MTTKSIVWRPGDVRTKRMRLVAHLGLLSASALTFPIMIFHLPLHPRFAWPSLNLFARRRKYYTENSFFTPPSPYCVFFLSHPGQLSPALNPVQNESTYTSSARAPDSNRLGMSRGRVPGVGKKEERETLPLHT